MTASCTEKKTLTLVAGRPCHTYPLDDLREGGARLPLEGLSRRDVLGRLRDIWVSGKACMQTG